MKNPLDVLSVIAPYFRNFQRGINVEFGKGVLRNIDLNGDVGVQLWGALSPVLHECEVCNRARAMR